MKTSILPALVAALALIAPATLHAQDDAAAKAAATATVKAKLAATVDGSGAVAPTPCNITDAADYGPLQEAACDNGLGYVIIALDGKPQAESCAQASQSVGDDGKLTFACRLTANRDPMAVADKVVKASDPSCNPVARAFVGESTSGSSVFFEDVCDSGKGYQAQVWKDHADKISVDKAWPCDPTTFTARGNSCDLTKSGVETAKASEAKRVALLNDYYNPKPAAAPAAAAPAAPASK